MKLIQQKTLWNNEGNADKVYEIDLCETGPGRYVVNFRYGRRGSALKEGSKTTLPVDLKKGEEIFNKLVAEKRKGGYQDADNYTAEPAPAEQPTTATTTAPSTETLSTLQTYVLGCLQEAAKPIPGKITEKWPLGRIIWRAGELRIAEAAPFILPQLTKGTPLLQYTACWALGRCGNPIAIAPLEQVYTSKATASHVKRMALTALLSLKAKNGTGKELVQTILNSLSAPLPKYLQAGDTASTKAQMSQLAANPATLEEVVTVYLLAEQYPAAATAVYEWLKEAKIGPNIFKIVRHIFKISEFREDAPVFALLAHKFEKTKGLFTHIRYNDQGYANYNNHYFSNSLAELKKKDSRLAYSETTHQYFVRRVWRTMRTLGKDGDETYVRYAFGVLLHYNQGLSGKETAEVITKFFYRYIESHRFYEQYSYDTTYAAFHSSHLLNYILYSNGSRYLRKRNTNAWQLQPGSVANDAAEREDAFPHLWDKYPQALVQLLLDSTVEVVHNFAVKALTGRSDTDGLIDIATLKLLLQKPFASTAKLALQLARNRYNPAAPDEELLSALLLHPVPEARALAIEWMMAQLPYFFEKTTLPAYAIANPYEDVFAAVNKWLDTYTPATETAERLVNGVLQQLEALPLTMPGANEATTHAAQILTNRFLPILSQVDVAIPARLLQHPLAAVQTLGAIILLHHQVLPVAFPQGVLSGMIQSGNPQVRQAGITLFGRLPEADLLENVELIAAFCVSPFAEVRSTIQPIVKTLNEKNNHFGTTLLADLLPYMQRKETAEGLHQNLYDLFTQTIAQHLADIDGETALALLHSRYLQPQLLGLFIVKNFDKAARFSMRQWVRMAAHEVLDIRQFAWQLYNENVDRIKLEAVESLRILDSSWADSRAFASSYFRQHFTEENWTPELLVSICDSTRPDVQAFGRQLITQYFKEENGEQYLLQLSQHPAQQVQQFTTHYLEQFATGKGANIKKLEAYFITVLSMVNKGGIAKKRIFHFLHQEAVKNEQVAQIATRVLARQSATMAVADKAACISILYALQKRYPGLQTPLSILPVATYQKQ